MATLQKIRNRGGLLLGIIGFAMLAFILGDLQKSERFFGESPTEIAEIAGKSIQQQTFLAHEQQLTELYKRSGRGINDALAEQIRAQAWDDLVRETIIADEFEKIGLAVSGQEMLELEQGNMLDPVVVQLFTNPQTGQVDRAQITNFLNGIVNKTVAPADAEYWKAIEQDIYQRRAYGKYMALINKSLYVTNAEAKADFEQRNYMVDFNYAVKPYESIADDQVTVSDDEIKAYYDKHKEQFKQDESRDIEYVAFELMPSEADRAAVKADIEKLKPEFEAADNVSTFVTRESEEAYQDRFFAKGQLSPEIDSLMFAAADGFVYGPYEENSAYKLARLVERKSMPDSVEARHILIRTDAQTSMEQAHAKADSIKGRIEAGESFADMAAVFGTDATRDKGGDLGWFAPGMMVKPFNDAVFSAKKNELLVVETQFGVHVVEVTGIGTPATMVKVAFVTRRIEPSEETYRAVFAEATKFASENGNAEKFNEALVTAGLNKRLAPRISRIENRIPGLTHPRELVRWAYNDETKVGDFSQVYEFGNKFVLATLTAIREEGIASLEEVRNQITAELRKDKKAEKLIAEMSGVTALNAVGEVKQAANANFAARQIEGLGVEPAVIGTAVALKKDELSKPIKGIRGVYMLQVTSITDPKFDAPNVEPNRKQLETLVQNRASYQAYQALKDMMEIQDKRSKFM